MKNKIKSKREKINVKAVKVYSMAILKPIIIDADPFIYGEKKIKTKVSYVEDFKEKI